MFKVAVGPLKWSTSEFWQSTPREFWAAIEASEEAAARLEEMRRAQGGA